MYYKISMRTLFIFTITVICLGFKFNNDRPEKYAEKLIKVLQTANVNEYKKFYLNCNGLKINYLKSIKDSIQKERFEKGYTTEKCEKELHRNYERFDLVIKQGLEKNIVWKKIKYKNIEYKITEGDHGIICIPNAKIFFTYLENEYYIEIKGLGKLNGSWNLGKITGPTLVTK